MSIVSALASLSILVYEALMSQVWLERSKEVRWTSRLACSRSVITASHRG